jgi:hypothetical protein
LLAVRPDPGWKLDNNRAKTRQGSQGASVGKTSAATSLSSMSSNSKRLSKQLQATKLPSGAMAASAFPIFGNFADA